MEKILNGMQYRWEISEFPVGEVESLATSLNVSTSVASILYKRGYKDKVSAQGFLFPTREMYWHDPHLMESSDLAVDRIIEAIEGKEKILVFGDYDVDGITSTSLLLYSLLMCKADANFFLPNRNIDGYGLSKKGVHRALSAGYSLIITVDNGITAYEALEYAKSKGIDVIVTDHHQPGENLPKGAFCIVNPQKKNCEYPFKGLAGVGVAFKIVSILFEKLNIPIPSKIYELLMLGTIADMVPLVDENRFLVQKALNIVSEDKSFSLEMLQRNTRAAGEFLSSSDIAYSIAPQLNAVGRISDPRLGVVLFLESDREKIISITKHLFELNEERKKIEAKVVEKAQKELRGSEENIKKFGCAICSSPDFPAGVIGLAATKICQFYGVPTCIFNEGDNGILKGSCRSIPECNIFGILSSIDQQGLLISYGGHKFAAGVAIKKEALEAFKFAFSEEVLKVCSDIDLKQKIFVDSILDLEDLNKNFWKDLSLLEPFGMENPEPVFCLQNVKIKKPKLLKDLHVKATINDGAKSCSVLFFNRPDLLHILKEYKDSYWSIIAKITENNWMGKISLELIGIDLKSE
jgi:single-stranded-DNA-specific exonuclease